MAFNNSRDILGQNFVKHLFVTVTLNENKVPSSFQDFSSCKNSYFVRYKSIAFICWTLYYVEINSPQENLNLILKRCSTREIPGQKRQNRFVRSPAK